MDSFYYGTPTGVTETSFVLNAFLTQPENSFAVAQSSIEGSYQG